jgi:hypothetical protein
MMNEDEREYVQNLFLLRFSRKDIRQTFAKQFGRHPVEEELEEVIADFEAKLRTTPVDPDFERQMAIRRLEVIYMKSFAIQDFKTCLGIQKELNRLREPAGSGRGGPWDGQEW